MTTNPEPTFDWEAWTPDLEATLLFVLRDERLLLIHKKRGLGAGKLNAAGGKVDPGETPLEAAVREFEEELRARPLDPRKAGEVAFHVMDGTAILIHVFLAEELEGEPRETEEAVPRWVPVDDIPYDRMWADDRYWLPLLLDGRHFEARAAFDGDALLSCEVFERESEKESR
ncbi:MAG: 8-oxo-dGTP diphosphatase [Gemmatimonadota bacterium]|nr:8-oxo-dGTP diphosphatase [Gemmatimonadota bacterium]